MEETEKTPCVVCGERPAHYRSGVCHICYMRAYNAARQLPRKTMRAKGVLCSEGDGKPARAKGLCRYHYNLHLQAKKADQ